LINGDKCKFKFPQNPKGKNKKPKSKDRSWRGVLFPCVGSGGCLLTSIKGSVMKSKCLNPFLTLEYPRVLPHDLMNVLLWHPLSFCFQFPARMVE
jgi:hypothetical protein